MRRLAILTVIGQAGIAVTGSVVRVTGSGLGCPTWPQCFPGSLVPTPHADIAALTQWIEFSNRLLTFVLVVATGLAFLAAINTVPRRTRLTWLGVLQPLGVVAQAVVGGFVVLAGLVWWSVAIHFMVSMFFVWMAVLLVDASGDGAGPARRVVPGAMRGLIATSTVVLVALLLAGTFVTASGPHAGDAKTPRLGLGVQATAQLHADILFAYLGLVVGIGFALGAVGASRRMWRRYAALVVLVLAQGALGGVQYALGVPEVLVSFHVLGAGLVTVGAAFLWSGTTERPHVTGVDEPTPELVAAGGA